MESKKCDRCHEVKLLSEFRTRELLDGSFYFSKSCKRCYYLRLDNWRKTVKGLIFSIYSHQKSHSKARGDVLPNYTKEELYDWMTNYDGFYCLYNKWCDSGYETMFRPSCDRLNDYKPYTFDNMRIVSWFENNKKSHYDKRNGINNKNSKAVIQETKDGIFIKEHYSINQAAREVNVSDSLIVRCCKGKRNHTAGFHWRYADPT